MFLTDDFLNLLEAMLTDFPNDSKAFNQSTTGKTTLYWKNYCQYYVLVNVHKILSHGENTEATIFTCAATSFTTIHSMQKIVRIAVSQQ